MSYQKLDEETIKIMRFIEQNEEMIDDLKRLIEYHKANVNKPNYNSLGFEFYEVDIPKKILRRLYDARIIKVVYKSSHTTGYIVRNPEALEKAIKLYEEGKKTIEIEEQVELTAEFIRDKVLKDIIGYEDLKDIVSRGIVNRVSILLVGPPASAKSLLLEALYRIPNTELVLGSRVSKAGLADFLISRRPRILLIDELDKMTREDYAVLLSLIQSGLVKETLYKRVREERLNTAVVAAANRIDKLPRELLSRFQILELKGYTFDEFKKITINILPKWEGINKDLAEYIAVRVWYDLMSMDVRDAVKVARLVKLNQTKEEVDKIISILKKYKYREY